jgi:phenylpropionate dioxygenase-like ring-hydroxylating dioxygenase large terminal subunit
MNNRQPTTIAPATDTGTAYGRQAGHHDAALTEVGAGTPMGELLRRYWLPIGIAADATDIPTMVRALGEDLVLFRDKSGRPGLVHPRCAHRGASLFYGRVEADGIRCCYHGWKFDVCGNCLDQPCEPERGKRSERFRQPWYPLEERYGLIFAYMGPPERKPLLPRYSIFENLRDGEQLFVDVNNLGAGTPVDERLVAFNWLQHFENIHDTAHFLWLHHLHSGSQFGQRFGDEAALEARPWEWVRGTRYEETPRGIMAASDRQLPDGRTVASRVETILPCIRVVPNPWGKAGPVDHLGFMLPVDDTHFRILTVLKAENDDYLAGYEKLMRQVYKKHAQDPTRAQRFPSDLEAQGSQGPITLHSEEHLVSSDLGIVLLRRLLRQQMDVVASGGDPINTAFEPGTETIDLEAGTFVTPAR